MKTKNTAPKGTILFFGTSKELKPHLEDLQKRYKTLKEAVDDLQSNDKEKFECFDCGRYYWVDLHFNCPNCKDKIFKKIKREEQKKWD